MGKQAGETLMAELFSPHDVDMRIAPPPQVVEKKPSLLNQLSDEQLLAKAMEMEVAGIPAVVPMVPPASAILLASSKRSHSLPTRDGTHPRPFGPTRPFMGGSPYHGPPGSNFRPRQPPPPTVNKKKKSISCTAPSINHLHISSPQFFFMSTQNNEDNLTFRGDGKIGPFFVFLFFFHYSLFSVVTSIVSFLNNRTTTTNTTQYNSHPN